VKKKLSGENADYFSLTKREEIQIFEKIYTPEWSNGYFIYGTLTVSGSMSSLQIGYMDL